MESVKGPKFDVLKPAVRAVVLQTDITGPGVHIVGDVKLVRCAVWALLGLSKGRQVDVVHFVAIQSHIDLAPRAPHLDVVPFTSRLHRVLGRFGQIVNCARLQVALPIRPWAMASCAFQ